MRTRPYVVIALLAGCGDNLHGAIDAGDVDARAIDAAADAVPLDVLASPCTDTVTTIQAGNPGSTAADYPAAGWWSDDTRANGTVAIDTSLGVPDGFGCTSVRMTTGASTPSPSADKAQLISFAQAGVALSTITTVGYWAFRSSASTGGPAIDLSFNVTITGSTVPGNFATLVYEPYNQSTGNAGILVDTWQHWDATATTLGDGLWWTTKIANPNPGSQSHPQPWATFQATYSDALVHGYGFDVGSVNPNMIIGGDGITFGATTTDF